MACNYDDDEDIGPSSVLYGTRYPLAARALRPGERVYRPTDGSPAVILRPGQPDPVPPEDKPPPPPMYNGVPWTPPVQSWDIKAQLRKHCAVPGCSGKRDPGSHAVYCAACLRRIRSHGDAHARKVKRPHVVRYLRAAKRYIRQHGESPEVLGALDTMRDLLSIGTEPPKMYGKPVARFAKRGEMTAEYALYRELRRLKYPPRIRARRRGSERHDDPRGPVTEREALTSVLTHWLLITIELEISRALGIDSRNIILGRAVLQLRRQYRITMRRTNNVVPVNGRALRLLGTRIAGRNEEPGRLALFLMKATETILAEDRIEKENEEPTAPVEPPPPPAPLVVVAKPPTPTPVAYRWHWSAVKLPAGVQSSGIEMMKFQKFWRNKLTEEGATELRVASVEEFNEWKRIAK